MNCFRKIISKYLVLHHRHYHPTSIIIVIIITIIECYYYYCQENYKFAFIMVVMEIKIAVVNFKYSIIFRFVLNDYIHYFYQPNFNNLINK